MAIAWKLFETIGTECVVISSIERKFENKTKIISFQGCTLLIDAVKRGDGFAAQFLLENDCDVNLTAKETADTALHLVCTYSDKSCDNDTFNDMILVAEALIQKGADPNVQNRRG